MFDGPVYVKEGDSWVDADETLKAEGDIVTPVASPSDVKASGGESLAGGEESVMLASMSASDSGGREVSLELGWEGNLPKPTLQGDTAVFEDAVGADGQPANSATGGNTSGDVSVTALRDGFSHSVVLESEPDGDGDLSWRYPLTLSPGLTASVDEASGAILVRDSAGSNVFGASAPLMWDARQDEKAGPNSPAVVKPVKVEIVSEDSGPVLVLTADGAFLHDQKTQYPVTVDPGWSTQSATDTWIQYPDYQSGQGSSQELKTGTYDSGGHKARSFIKFNTSALAGKQILGANIRLYNYYSGSCTGDSVAVQRVTGGWDPFAITWSNQPGATSIGQVAGPAAKGYNSSCPAGQVSWGSVGAIVQEWANGVPNNGFRIVALNENSNFTWRRYRSADYGTVAQRPLLDATYNSYPNTPWSPGSGPYKYWTDPATGARSTYIPTAHPTLSALVSDPDGGQVKELITLSKSGQMLWNKQAGSVVASGGRSTYTPPANAPLSDGTYTWTVWASDGSLTSKGALNVGTFIIDTVAPAKPTITATGYQSDNWLDTAPATNTFTYSSTSADTDTFEISQDGGAWVTKPASGTGPRTGTLAWAPDNGAHTLAVRAVDRAGNISPTQTFTFGAGQASLSSPVNGTKSNDNFALSASAPPANSGTVKAEVYWRAAGAAEPSDFDPVRGSTTGWTKQGSETTSSAGKPIEVKKDFSGAGAASDLKQERVPVLLDVQVCFTYTSPSVVRCTWQADAATHSSVLRVPHAFGAGFPTADAGPGQVALWTGEFQTSDSDVSVPGYAGDLSISRTYSSFDGSISATESVFGPGWRAGFDGEGTGGATYTVYDSTLVDGTFALVDDEGEALVFAQPGGGRIQAKAGVYSAVDTDTQASTVRFEVTGSGINARALLTEDDGTITTYKPLAFTAGQATEWVVESEADPTDPGKTTYSYDASGRVTRILSPAPAGVTCGAGTALNPGCRALHITYASATTATDSAPGTYTGRVEKISYQAYNPTKSGGAGMETVVVASYAYDGAGCLVAVTDPRNNLTRTYGWGAKLASGQPALTVVKQPGLAAFYLGYGTTSQGSDGLISVRRDPASGSGDKVQLARFVYGLDPTKHSAGQPNLTADDIALWGQGKAPTWGAAVFGLDRQVTSSNPADLSSADWAYAVLQFTDAQGYTINSASFGAGAWQITANDYDDKGNVVKAWDAGGIDRVRQAAARDGVRAGETYPNAGDHATMTKYNPDITAPADIPVDVAQADGSKVIKAGSVIVPAGTLVTDTWGPVTSSASGEQVRVHTHTDYDAGAPNQGVKASTGIAFQLATSATVSEASPGTATVDRGAPVPTGEPVVSQSRTGYDPINGLAATDPTSGWMLGQATSTATLMGGGAADIVTQTRYDSEGRAVEVRKPGSNGADAATTLTTFYSVAGSGACGGKPQWAGMTCQIAPGGTPAGEAASVTTTTAEYSFYMAPARVVESAGAASRVTATTFTSDGVVNTVAVTTAGVAGSTPLPISKNIYDSATGMQIGTASLDSLGAETGRVSMTKDAWGRQTSYVDSDGAVTRTEYNETGQVSKTIDPTGTTTYGYDGTDVNGKVEHRGLTTKVDVSGGGSFTAAYDASGAMVRQDMPGGIRQDSSFDADTGQQTGQSYSGAGGQWLAWEMAHNSQGNLIAETTPGPGAEIGGDSIGGYDRTYTYDRAGRLTTVVDAASAADDDVAGTRTCATRSYGFDARGNRTSLASATGTAGACASTPGAAKTWRHDSAGRVLAGANNSGSYAYDGLGRQTTLPAVDTPQGVDAGNLSIGYYDSDLVKTISQGGAKTDYSLDPAGRRKVATTTNGTTTETLTRHYVDESDNPGWATLEKDGNVATTRYAGSIAGDLGLTISENSVKLTLADPHGDVVATVAVAGNGASAGIESWADADEYGNPLTELADTGAISYGWLGAKERPIEASGLVLMGVRLYNSVTGLFTSIDPVEGGNATDYAYPQDPINKFDLDGKKLKKRGFWGQIWGGVQRLAKNITNSRIGKAVGIACGFVPITAISAACGAVYTLAYAAQGRWREAAVSAVSSVGGGLASYGVGRLAIKGAGLIRQAPTASRSVRATKAMLKASPKSYQRVMKASEGLHGGTVSWAVSYRWHWTRGKRR